MMDNGELPCPAACKGDDDICRHCWFVMARRALDNGDRELSQTCATIALLKGNHVADLFIRRNFND